MPGVLHNTFRGKRRKGISIVESLVLMIVLGVTFGAIFTTLGSAYRAHANSRHDRESREVLFSWVQAFESFFPPPLIPAPTAPPGTPPPPPVPPDINATANIAQALLAATQATQLMGGTPNNTAIMHTGTNVRGFTVQATPAINTTNVGVMDINIVISGVGRSAPWVTLSRSFNRFSNEMVPDWSEEDD